MKQSITRREALGRSAGLMALGLLPGAQAAGASSSRSGAAEVHIPISPGAFRPPTGRRGLRVTTPLRASRELDVLGLRWKRPAQMKVELRTHRGGRWSPWVMVPATGGHGPDSRQAGPVTEAVAVGEAQVFQLRTAHVPTGLVAVGIALERRPSGPARVAASAARGVAGAIVPRSAWDAQPPRSSPALGEVALAFVHHTVSTNDYGPDESAAIVRAVQHYHRNTLGWNDIGYNLLVDRHGQVFEGRAGGVERAVVGAQAQGYNSVSTGVAMIGTHTSDAVPAVAFEALAAVLAWKLSLHGVPATGRVTVTSAGGPLNRYPSGRAVTLQRISGHRDGDSTACPGEALYARLSALRARAAELATPTGLSLSVIPRRVDQLAPATASGRLLLPDGSPGAGVGVEIQASSSSGWVPVASAVADPSGAFGASVALPYTRSLRAVASPAPLGSELSSPPAVLEVRSQVSATIGPTRLRFGRRTVVRGTVEPPRKRRRLIVTVERRDAGGRYRRVVRFATSERNGRFKVPLHPLRPGLYRVRISVPADRLNAGSRSAFLFARALR